MGHCPRLVAVATFTLVIGCAPAFAQPFAWFAGGSSLHVVNTATGETVFSPPIPAGVQLGQGDIDRVSGHYLAITNAGTYRIRLSDHGIEPGVLPYSGQRLRLSPDGTTLFVCAFAVVTECRWRRRTDDTVLATFSSPSDIQFAGDSSLLVLTRRGQQLGPYELRRYTVSNPSVQSWTIELAFASLVRASATRVAVSVYENSSASRIRVFDLASGSGRGDLAFSAIEAMQVSGGELAVAHYTSDGTRTTYRLTRYNLETLETIANGTLLYVGFTASLERSADGRQWYLHRSSSGRSPSYWIEVFDASTLAMLFVRRLPNTFGSMTLSPDPICPFAISPPPPSGSVLTVPSRGGVIEIRVTTEARCGPWRAAAPATNAGLYVLGPALRAGSDTVHIVVPPRAEGFGLSSNVTIAGMLYPIAQERESEAALPPIDLTLRVEGATPTLRWSVGEGPVISGFLVQAGPAGGPLQLSEQLPATARSWSPGPLAAGNYYVQIRALNNVASSPIAGPVNFGVGATQPPGAPTNLRADVRGSYLRLTWDPPASGPAISRYVIEAGRAGGPRAIVAQAAGLSPVFTTGNVPAGNWDIAVRAVNDAGTSAASNVVSIAAAACSAPPDPPTAVSAVVTDNVVTIAWSVPPSGADAFILEVGSAVGRSDLARIPLAPSPTRLDVPAPSGAYALRLRAVNSCGPSAVSTERIIGVR